MSYPLIILGAGASYDYIHPSLREGRKMPPLTDHLVDKRFLDDDIVYEYSDVSSIISVIATQVNTRNKTLEDCLKSEKFDYVQLASLSFYLRDLFEKISNQYYPINNYKIIIEKILKSSQKACIVTFNYDSLLEMAIDKNFSDDYEDNYINGDIKIIKLHGSWNWSYRKIRNPKENFSDFDYLKSNPAEINNFYGHHFYYDNPLNIREEDKYRKFPVLLVPTNKEKEFICRQTHVDILEKETSKIDKILIIGWKAGDSYLLNLLRRKITKPVDLTIVSGNDGIENLRSIFNSIPNINVTAECVGFSNFVADSVKLNNFFS